MLTFLWFLSGAIATVLCGWILVKTWCRECEVFEPDLYDIFLGAFCLTIVCLLGPLGLLAGILANALYRATMRVAQAQRRDDGKSL